MKPSFIYNFIMYVGGALMHIIFPAKVIGKENLPKDKGYIICCNHTHFLDVAYLVGYLKIYIRFMAKEELFGSKKSRWFLNKMGAFPVARGAGTGAISAIRTAKQIIKNNVVLGIFPEGTRSLDGRPKRAKSGAAFIAAAAKADVVPVSIYYTGKLRPFRKVTLRVGTSIPKETLAVDVKERAELKRVTETIMGRITEQWEAGHCK